MDESNSINDLLNRFESLLHGFNYECYFQFYPITNSTEIAIANNKINSDALISFEDFKKDIIQKLSYRGEEGAGVILSKTKEELFSEELKKLWILFEQKFQPNLTSVYIYPEIHSWIYWGFCFLIVSKESNNIYLFEGISSD